MQIYGGWGFAHLGKSNYKGWLLRMPISVNR
jgi:hypothetical protein